MIGRERRQVFDLPPIELTVIEHQAERRACGCGVVTTATFPVQATAPTCYGPGVAALGAYLLARQHLPVERAAECLADCFGAPVSTGYLASLLPAAAGRLEGFLALVGKELTQAEVAHFDETGGRVKGKLWWIHVACTDRYTLYHLDTRRGKTAMDAAGVLPSFTGVAVHDGLAAYRQYTAADHALCGAHHLRELAGIAQLTGQQWPSELAELLVEMNLAVGVVRANGGTALPAKSLAGYRRRYDALIVAGKELNPPPPRTGKPGRPALGPAGSLLARLHTHREDVLRFATDLRVSFTNNQAEADVRMVKLQQKISGGWRSQTGAESFLAVRSYLSTARKHGQQAMDVLRSLFTDRGLATRHRRPITSRQRTGYGSSTLLSTEAIAPASSTISPIFTKQPAAVDIAAATVSRHTRRSASDNGSRTNSCAPNAAASSPLNITNANPTDGRSGSSTVVTARN